MMKSREKSLPADSHIPAYGSLYHLTVNTYLPDTQKGKWINIGDPVNIIGPVKLEARSE
jgi:hypothetical protein